MNEYISYKLKYSQIFEVLIIILPLFLILEATSLINAKYVTPNLLIYFIEQTSIIIGITIGIIISHQLFTKYKLRILTFLPILLLSYFILGGLLYTLEPFTTTIREILNQINPYINDFFTTHINGILIGIISHLIISRYKKPSLITVTIISIIISYYEIGQGYKAFITEIPTLSTFDKYKILFTILVLILAFYQYIKSTKKKLKPTLIFISSLIISLVIASYTGNLLIKNFTTLNKELEKIDRKQEKTYLPENTPPIDSNDPWKKFDPNEKINLAAVGYYKAPHPVYLKTEIYTINRYGSLNIKPENNITGKYYSEYTTTPTSSNLDIINPSETSPNSGDTAYSEHLINTNESNTLNDSQANSKTLTDLKETADLQPSTNTESNSESTDIKIIYKYKENQLLPSTSKILKFQNEYYSKKYGIFTSNKYNTNNVWHHTYQSENYNPYKDYNPNYEETVELNLIKTDFNYISSYSQDYYEIKDLTEQITKDLETDYKKAKAVEKYLKANYYYSLKPNIKDQENPISEFLLENKHGYCTHFATAMSIMLETIDIDSRVVGGFYSNKYSQQLESFVMLNTDLHAWNEVFIDNYGWVTFDATSSRCDSQTDNCTEIRYGRSGSDENNNYLLHSVNPKLDFDDIFNEPEKVKFPEEPENPDTEDKKKNEKIKNEMNTLYKYTTITVFLIIFLTILYTQQERIKIFIKRIIKIFQDREDKAARRLNSKLKKSFADSLNQRSIKSQNLSTLTDKQFINLVSHYYPNSQNNLKKFYSILNQVLYSNQTSTKALEDLRKLSWEIQRQFSKKQNQEKR